MLRRIDLERQLRYGGGAYGVERRLAQLEQRVDYIASRTRYGRYGYNNYGNQWNGDHNWTGTTIIATGAVTAMMMTTTIDLA